MGTVEEITVPAPRKASTRAATKKVARMAATPSAADLAAAGPRFAPVVAAFRRDPAVTSGKLMSSFGLKVNGKIFAMVARGNLVLKLPQERVTALVEAGIGEHFDPGHGRLMKQWISITDRGADWLALSREAYRFVRQGAAQV